MIFGAPVHAIWRLVLFNLIEACLPSVSQIKVSVNTMALATTLNS